MSEQPQRPDRANEHDLDVPEYTPPASSEFLPASEEPTTTMPKIDPSGTLANAEPMEEVEIAEVAESAEQVEPEPIEAVEAEEEVELIEEPKVSDSPLSGLYKRAGRAAPQAIPAQPAAEATPEQEPAAVVGRTVVVEYPAESYGDEDFASVTPVASVASAEPTKVAATEPQVARPETVVVAQAAATGSMRALDETVIKSQQKEPSRGTTDLGLLVLRIGLATFLVLHSLGTFFQLGGGTGMLGLQDQFTELGYNAPQVLAIMIPTMQLAAGLFLVFGLLTPLFASVAVIATGFGLVHGVVSAATLNVFVWSDGLWLAMVLFALALAVQFTGPGLYSLDYGRDWAHRPLVSSWIFFVVGVVGIALIWVLGAGVNPL